MHAGLLLWSLLGLLPSVICSRYTLHHKISSSSSWVPRATITLNKDGASPIYQDATGSVRPWEALNAVAADPSQLYQLALTPESEKTVGPHSPMTFARACLLETASDESITIHQRTDASQLEAHALSYDLLGVDVSKLASSGCPIEAVTTSSPKTLNIQVALPDSPLSPLPPNPPPVKADGTPIQEGEELPKEKSFLAKYWYYFVPLVLLMAIPTELADSAAENDEEGAENPFQAGAQLSVAGAAKRGGAGAGAARKR